MSFNQYFNKERVIFTLQRCQFNSLCKLQILKMTLQTSELLNWLPLCEVWFVLQRPWQREGRLWRSRVSPSLLSLSLSPIKFLCYFCFTVCNQWSMQGMTLTFVGVVDEGVSMTTCEFDALLLWVLSLAL